MHVACERPRTRALPAKAYHLGAPRTAGDRALPGHRRGAPRHDAAGRPFCARVGTVYFAAARGRKGRNVANAHDTAAVGVIGGSGFYELLQDAREVTLHTPFGDPSDCYFLGDIDGVAVAFLPRHARGHRILPGEVNYRANIWGMKALGVHSVLSASAVGSLREAAQAARRSGARPALRPHQGPPQHLLRRGRGGAHGLRRPLLPVRRASASSRRAVRPAPPCTRAAPTCASRARSSPPGPSRACTASSASTSSA